MWDAEAVGWVGFDPTNDLLAHKSHIRTALGRDYEDVPPTRGVYRGTTAGELRVAVQVTEHETAPQTDEDWPIPEDWSVHVERALEPPPLPHLFFNCSIWNNSSNKRNTRLTLKDPISPLSQLLFPNVALGTNIVTLKMTTIPTQGLQTHPPVDL